MRDLLQSLRLRWTFSRAARSTRPILIGPFRSELGFEVLYWLPLIQAWRHRYQIDPQRLIVVSRGGAGAWYGAGRSIDLYDLASVEECRIQAKLDRAETHLEKQTRITAFDRDLYAKVAAELGVRPLWLHPSLMYRGLAGWWQERMPLAQLGALTRYAPLQVGTVPEGWQLPPEFVAVRFYARATFPYGPETLDAAQKIVARLAKKVPVVILNPQVHVDDHVDFRFGGENVWQMPMVPANQNLALAAAVLQRATAFVGTYGGFAQLALRLGIPSVSFYQAFHSTAIQHVLLSQLLAVKTKTSFQVLALDQAPLWRQLLI